MNRLTARTDSGGYHTSEHYMTVQEELHVLRNKLGKYEDTGLEPDEIATVQEGCTDDFIDKQEKFEIPPEIEVKMPSYFIAAFVGELLSVFGRDVVLIDSDGEYNIWWYTGTGGWRDAFFVACKKLKLDWFNEYRESLEWYDADCFDEIICERVCDFLNGNAAPSNSYCNYINERERKSMKIRTDFVANSSSSSFIISKKVLSEEQADAIRYHYGVAEKLNLFCYDQPWHIEENNGYIGGYTSMDNFSMSDYLDMIGVSDINVIWGEYFMELPDGENTSNDCDDYQIWIDALREYMGE